MFTAAPASETKEGDAAKALIAYLKSPTRLLSSRRRNDGMSEAFRAAEG